MTNTFRFARLLLTAAPLFVAACSTTNTTAIRPTPQDLPQASIQSYDRTNACIAPIVSADLGARKETILFLTDSLPDLTKNGSDWTSGALSAAGATMLNAQLRRYGGPEIVLQGVTSAEVRAYVRSGQELSVPAIRKLQRQYGARRMFLLSGGFVGYDQSHTSDGIATSGGYKGRDVEFQAETGRAMESGRIDFILNVIDPLANRLLATITLSGTERRRSTSTKITLDVYGAGAGLSSQNVEADGPQNVQSSIIAAAHYFLWQKILPGDAINACLYDPSSSPAAFAQLASAYEAADAVEKVRLLQTALNDLFGDTRAKLKVDGVMGGQTLASAREAERQIGLPPATRADFATLYAHLIENRKGAVHHGRVRSG